MVNTNLWIHILLEICPECRQHRGRRGCLACQQCRDSSCRIRRANRHRDYHARVWHRQDERISLLLQENFHLLLSWVLFDNHYWCRIMRWIVNRTSCNEPHLRRILNSRIWLVEDPLEWSQDVFWKRLAKYLQQRNRMDIDIDYII